MDITKTINDIISKEKGFVDHPSDRGGPTNFGITEAVARMNGYRGNMSEMPRDFAAKVYSSRYISGPKFDMVSRASDIVGAELIDTGVNMGPATAAIFFQRLLNAFNAQGSKYPDMFVDGQIGQVTLQAFKAFLAWRGEEGAVNMAKALNHVQGARYLDIAEANKSQEDFLYGWIANRT